jgi:hypothetical protein
LAGKSRKSGMTQKEQTMKLARVGVIAAAILAVATMAYAQKPDFSGTWTPDPATAGGGGGGRGMGGPMTVKQDATTLSIERTQGENKVVTTYKLDGSETVAKQTGRGGAEVEVKTSAKWDGSKLVLTMTRPGRENAPMTTAQTWSLEGGNLVVERAGQDGTPIKTTYKKTT